MARKAEVILDIHPNAAGWTGMVRRMETDLDRLARQAQGVAPGGGGRGGGGGGTAGAAAGGFRGDFFARWGTAGGMAGALATVTKYALAYKAVESASRLAMAPVHGLEMAVASSVRSMFDYSEAMANASRTMRQMGMSTEVLKSALGRDALRFITQYRVSLQEAAKAQYELGSANFDAATVMQTYQVPLKVNIALMGDITQTTRTMTQMLKIHGAQMGANVTDHEKMVRIGGILLKTWEIEQVELADIIQAYKYVAGNAATLKIRVEELIPTLGFLSTYGLRGSIGGTGLNQFFMQASKNIRITKEDVIELHKAIRGGEHTISLGLKAGELTSPLQILIELSKTVQGMQGNLAGRMQIAKVLGDIFNIRGARPAALLADMERLGELLKNIGDVSRMTVADFDAYIERMVAIRQETPQAQMELLNNQVYATGVQFMNAALGAETFVGALRIVRQIVSDLTPMLRDLGQEAGARIAGIGAVLKHWQETGRGPLSLLNPLTWSENLAVGTAAYESQTRRSIKAQFGVRGAAALLKEPEILGNPVALEAWFARWQTGMVDVMKGKARKEAIARRPIGWTAREASEAAKLPQNVGWVEKTAGWATIEAIDVIRNMRMEDITGPAAQLRKEEQAGQALQKTQSDLQKMLRGGGGTPRATFTPKAGGGAARAGAARRVRPPSADERATEALQWMEAARDLGYYLTERTGVLYNEPDYRRDLQRMMTGPDYTTMTLPMRARVQGALDRSIEDDRSKRERASLDARQAELAEADRLHDVLVNQLAKREKADQDRRDIAKLEQEIADDEAEAARRTEEAERAREGVYTEAGLRIAGAVIGWMPGGTPAQMRARIRAQIDLANTELALEMDQRRTEFGPDPFWDVYEQTMRTENIIRPWLDARDRIEKDWSSMFQRLYSDLVSGGASPWKAFVQSVTGSFQEQIFQSMASRLFGPLFDIMATEATGIKGREILATQAVVTELDAFTLALQRATATIEGPNWAGPSGPVMGLMGLSDAEGAAKDAGRKQASWLQKSFYEAMRNYSQGQMIGGMIGQITSGDIQRSQVYGGAGAVIGGMLGGPVGAAAGGFLGGLFGAGERRVWVGQWAGANDDSQFVDWMATMGIDPNLKRFARDWTKLYTQYQQSEQSAGRSIYGMPEFEYRSYLYNMTTGAGARGTGAGGAITININGGDAVEVKRVVEGIITETFGGIALLQARKRGSLTR